MSNYYSKQEAKVRIAHELMKRGWKVYGYHADESDSMTDYYSPAYWNGIKQAPFCIFENVDRLLKSPAKQRGRDFGIILSCLAELGYSAEWRVVNAATYGAAQRRRRTFIWAYKNETNYGKKMSTAKAKDIISKSGLMAKTFPIISAEEITETTISKDVVEVSDSFSFAFETAGYMTDYHIYTAKVTEKEEEPNISY